MAKAIFAVCGLVLVHAFLSDIGSESAAGWLTAGLATLLLIWAGLARA